MEKNQLPIVGIICDQEIIGPHPFHIAGDKYIQAIVKASNCTPILIPALGNTPAIQQLITRLDGLLLTGGYSMVDPLHYQTTPADAETKLDTARDSTSLPLINAAIEHGVPLLGICRGFQEINVALGGSLHQKLHENGHYLEHRENKSLTLEQQYGESHSINLTENGKLANILGKTHTQVNSLHTQGVNNLAEHLSIEAFAEDGLVEAFSIDTAITFAMAVQWHPEWKVEENQDSTKLFQAFGQACRAKQNTRENNG
ncbi:gamma-glutamyl-gamma-aminobutyrate hydrolase family protein [Colwelliaceae bacterium 6471]